MPVSSYTFLQINLSFRYYLRRVAAMSPIFADEAGFSVFCLFIDNFPRNLHRILIDAHSVHVQWRVLGLDNRIVFQFISTNCNGVGFSTFLFHH